MQDLPSSYLSFIEKSVHVTPQLNSSLLKGIWPIDILHSLIPIISSVFSSAVLCHVLHSPGIPADIFLHTHCAVSSCKTSAHAVSSALITSSNSPLSPHFLQLIPNSYSFLKPSEHMIFSTKLSWDSAPPPLSTELDIFEPINSQYFFSQNHRNPIQMSLEEQSKSVTYNYSLFSFFSSPEFLKSINYSLSFTYFPFTPSSTTF